MFEKSKNDQRADLSTISHEDEQSCSHGHSSCESETSISMAKKHEGMSEMVTLSTESTTEACDETDKVSDINIVVDEIQPKLNVPHKRNQKAIAS